jgi:DNA-binding GntR family transcriptional regulator
MRIATEMFALPQFGSVGSGVYQAIHQEIVRLDVSPGGRLRLNRIAARLGVSHTPVREALLRLRGEGLVEFTPRRGARAAPLSYQELEEIQAIRLGVEPILARRATLKSTDMVHRGARSRLQKILSALERKDLDEYLAAYAAFRDAYYRLAERPRLLRIAQEQRARAERYLRFLCRDARAMKTSGRHQVEFLAACEASDGEAAEAATRRALLWTLSQLGELLEANRQEDSAP